MKDEWKSEVKKAIENNLFYFVQCPHCETVDRSNIERMIQDLKKTIPET